MTKFHKTATEIADLTARKNQAYGESYAKSGQILQLLYPNGIGLNQMRDALAITRCIDKFFRIATRKNAFGESPWADVAGYALLGIVADDVDGDLPLAVKSDVNESASAALAPAPSYGKDNSTHGAVDGPLDAMAIIIRDRDEWKRRAVASEERYAKIMTQGSVEQTLYVRAREAEGMLEAVKREKQMLHDSSNQRLASKDRFILKLEKTLSWLGFEPTDAVRAYVNRANKSAETYKETVDFERRMAVAAAIVRSDREEEEPLF